MKLLHIKGNSTEKFTLKQEAIDQLPDQLALCTTIQFMKSLPEITKQLEDAGKKIILLQGAHSTVKGQILGCDVPKIDDDVQAVLYIGDGEFHPKALFLKNNIQVFSYNHFNETIREIKEEDVAKFSKQKRIALTKFYASDKIGLMVTIKSGQRVSDTKLKELETKFPDKTFYKFVSDTIDFSQLENFPFIESWINTACPRIGYDDNSHLGKAILNLGDIE